MNAAGFNLCPPPFLQENLFGSTHGAIGGRLCAPVGDVRCCLPCPATDWVYPDNFDTMVRAVDGFSLVGVIGCIFLLLSWAFLPVEKTNRHYLSICFTIGVLLMNLGFVVTLAAQPDPCYDAITPNDLKTSKVCGASASLMIFGGWLSITWALLRALSLHLQICWQVELGTTFATVAMAAGWGIPVIGLVLALVFSGESFRFGDTCHINQKNSLADLWIPLLVFCGVTLVTTLATFGYCVKVFLQSLGGVSSSVDGASSLPTTNSVTTTAAAMTPRQAYRRVRRVIALQWRGIAIVLIMVIDCIFFAVVLVFQDQTITNVTKNPTIAEPWIICLVASSGDKNKCLDKKGSLAVSEPTIGAVLALFGLNGIFITFLLGRKDMILGWVELGKSFMPSKWRHPKEFVSVDARCETAQDRHSYEMISSQQTVEREGKNGGDGGAVEEVAEKPLEGQTTPEYYAQTAVYNAPTRSYSKPRSMRAIPWRPS